MKIIGWGCICPNCRHHFTAYLADVWDPPRDEVDASKRSVLCNVCDQILLNRVYQWVREELGINGRFPLDKLSLPALQTEAQRAGEPRHEAEAGAGPTRGVPARVHGVPYRDRNASMEDRVSGPPGEAPETLRGQAALPAEQPE